MNTTDIMPARTSLDLRVEELEIAVGPQNCAGVTDAQCDFYTAAGISASFISFVAVIT